jgi:dihydroorotase
MQKYLLKNIAIVNEGKIVHADVLINGERIEKIGPALMEPGKVNEIDGEGKHLLPGVIDDQVHFREPASHIKQPYIQKVKLLWQEV